MYIYIYISRRINNTRSDVHFTKYCINQELINYYQFFRQECKLSMESKNV